MPGINHTFIEEFQPWKSHLSTFQRIADSMRCKTRNKALKNSAACQETIDEKSIYSQVPKIDCKRNSTICISFAEQGRFQASSLITDPVASGSIYSSPPVASTTLGLSPWSSYPALPACTNYNQKKGNLPWRLAYGMGKGTNFQIHLSLCRWRRVNRSVNICQDGNQTTRWFKCWPAFPVILGQWDWWQVQAITFSCWKNPILLATKRTQSPNPKCCSPGKKNMISLYTHTVPSMYRVFIIYLFMV